MLKNPRIRVRAAARGHMERLRFAAGDLHLDPDVVAHGMIGIVDRILEVTGTRLDHAGREDLVVVGQ